MENVRLPESALERVATYLRTAVQSCVGSAQPQPPKVAVKMAPSASAPAASAPAVSAPKASSASVDGAATAPDALVLAGATRASSPLRRREFLSRLIFRGAVHAGAPAAKAKPPAETAPAAPEPAAAAAPAEWPKPLEGGWYDKGTGATAAEPATGVVAATAPAGASADGGFYVDELRGTTPYRRMESADAAAPPADATGAVVPSSVEGKTYIQSLYEAASRNA